MNQKHFEQQTRADSLSSHVTLTYRDR